MQRQSVRKAKKRGKTIQWLEKWWVSDKPERKDDKTWYACWCLLICADVRADLCRRGRIWGWWGRSRCGTGWRPRAAWWRRSGRRFRCGLGGCSRLWGSGGSGSATGSSDLISDSSFDCFSTDPFISFLVNAFITWLFHSFSIMNSGNIWS